MTKSYLIHYGIPGMKWGQRKTNKSSSKNKASYTVKTKHGETLSFIPNKSRIKNSYSYSIKNEKGKKVANYYLDKVSKDELNINWLNTKSKYRGKGYAQAIIKKTDDIAKDFGVKKITAEAIGASKDIQHILKKHGYKNVGKSVDEETDMVWGGLNYVEKTIKKKR